MSTLKLTDSRLEELKEIVVELFDKYNISCVPISAFEIATRMGVKVVPYSAYNRETQNQLLKYSTDGFSLADHGVYTIFYNDRNVYGRINNTIMHEIAHIVLKHYEESELAEAEANFFAKYALAPPPLVHKLKISSPREIGFHFEISKEAAYYAYNYYKKWLDFGGDEYKSYEMKLLDLFSRGNAT